MAVSSIMDGGGFLLYMIVTIASLWMEVTLLQMVLSFIADGSYWLVSLLMAVNIIVDSTKIHQGW